MWVQVLYHHYCVFLAVRGCSHCEARAPAHRAQWLWYTGSVAPRHVGSPTLGAERMSPAFAAGFFTTEPPGKPLRHSGMGTSDRQTAGGTPPQEGGREGAATSGQGSALHSPPSIPPPTLFLSSSCLVIPGARLWEVRFREMTLTHFCHADMSLGFTEGMGDGVGKISPSWGARNPFIL